MSIRNHKNDCPQIDDTAYIHPTAVVTGKVTIGRNVFVAPWAVIKADEPSSSS